MPYATVAHLAGLATNGWQELTERACPTSPDVEPELMQAVATGASTAAWPGDTVALAMAGVAHINTALDMASRHVDTYLYPRYRAQMPLPQAVVDASPLADVVAALALRRLYGTAVPEDVAKGTAWADAYLRDVSKGTVSLGAADTVVAQPAGHTTARTAPKAFDWDGY